MRQAFKSSRRDAPCGGRPEPSKHRIRFANQRLTRRHWCRRRPSPPSLLLAAKFALKFFDAGVKLRRRIGGGYPGHGLLQEAHLFFDPRLTPLANEVAEVFVRVCKMPLGHILADELG